MLYHLGGLADLAWRVGNRPFENLLTFIRISRGAVEQDVPVFGRSGVLEMIGELLAGVPGLQFVVDASETHVRPVIPLALSESD